MSDRTIRIGIIGAGFARTTQIPGFQNCEGARIVAINSARREHAAEVAREFGIENVEDDWRKLIKRDDVDLISVVTPPFTHCEMTLGALDRGKAVLCEKPMAMNAAEAQQMADRAQQAGCLALIDHELRFLPGRIKLRELLRQGTIGKVQHVNLQFRSDARLDPEVPWNWWSDVSKGGGVLGAIGSHVIDAFRWLLGTDVAEVFCDLATQIHERKDETGLPRKVTTDDEANLLLRFADSELTDKATGNLSLSIVEAGKPEHRLELFGRQGAFRLTGRHLWHSRPGERDWKVIEIDPGELALGLNDNPWARGFTTFSKKIVEALREGRIGVEGAATFADGYRTQLVLDAARRANDRRCWETV